MSDEATTETDKSGREVRCFQILPFGRWCRLAWGHDGEHEPNRQAG